MDSPGNLVVFWMVLFTTVGTLVLCQDVTYRTPWPVIDNRWSPNRSQSTGQHVSNSFPTHGGTPTPVLNTASVQDEELRTFTENLLLKDYNNIARYMTVNYQGITTSRSSIDQAPNSLIQIHHDAFNLPTVDRLVKLFDNYVTDSSIAEQATNQEKQEENNFLDKIMETQIMEFTRSFLVQKGKIGNAPQELKNILREIWFTMYPRGGRKVSSSGFEHVFLGELKNGEVSGMHNSISFSMAEANNALNYLGYLKVVQLGNKGAVLKHHFKFHNVDKPVASMFIGTSPELEVALYSTCFLLRPNQVCPVRLGGHNFIIRTYTYQYQGKSLIGSAFPEI